MKQISSNIARALRYQYLKIVRLKDSPRNIAKGLALGIFLGMTPTMGFQMPIAFAFASILKENKVASVLGVWVTNPITAPAIYFFNYKLGAMALGLEATVTNKTDIASLLRMGANIAVPLWLGGFITGIFAAIISYFLTLRSVRSYRANKAIIRKKIQQEKEIIRTKLAREKEVIKQKVHEDSQKISDFLHHKKR